MSKLKIKKQEQNEKKKTVTQRKRLLCCEVEIKTEEELKNYQLFEELGKGAYGIVKMGMNKKNS
jgi:hypothetical protein